MSSLHRHGSNSHQPEFGPALKGVLVMCSIYGELKPVGKKIFQSDMGFHVTYIDTLALPTATLRLTATLSMLQDKLPLATLNNEFPCRELQIRQLASLFAVRLGVL